MDTTTKAALAVAVLILGGGAVLVARKVRADRQLAQVHASRRAPQLDPAGQRSVATLSPEGALAVAGPLLQQKYWHGPDRALIAQLMALRVADGKPRRDTMALVGRLWESTPSFKVAERDALEAVRAYLQAGEYWHAV